MNLNCQVSTLLKRGNKLREQKNKKRKNKLKNKLQNLSKEIWKSVNYLTKNLCRVVKMSSRKNTMFHPKNKIIQLNLPSQLRKNLRYLTQWILISSSKVWMSRNPMNSTLNLQPRISKKKKNLCINQTDNMKNSTMMILNLKNKKPKKKRRRKPKRKRRISRVKRKRKTRTRTKINRQKSNKNQQKRWFQ